MYFIKILKFTKYKVEILIKLYLILINNNYSSRWIGSAHDSRIWNGSLIKEQFENGSINGISLGEYIRLDARSYGNPAINPNLLPDGSFLDSLFSKTLRNDSRRIDEYTHTTLRSLSPKPEKK